MSHDVWYNVTNAQKQNKTNTKMKFYKVIAIFIITYAGETCRWHERKWHIQKIEIQFVPGVAVA